MSKELHFFKATLKGGHVGKRLYVEFNKYTAATSRKEAARLLRDVSRVKRNHKDYILDIVEITKDEYCLGKESEKSDPYLQCHSGREQEKIIDKLSDRIKPDMHYLDEQKKHKGKAPVSEKKYKTRYVYIKEDCAA